MGDLVLRGQALPDHGTWHRGSREAGGSYIEDWAYAAPGREEHLIVRHMAMGRDLRFPAIDTSRRPSLRSSSKRSYRGLEPANRNELLIIPTR